MNKVGPMNACREGAGGWRGGDRHGVVDESRPARPDLGAAAVLAVVMSNSFGRGSGIEVRAGDIEEDIVEGRCTKAELAHLDAGTPSAIATGLSAWLPFSVPTRTSPPKMSTPSMPAMPSSTDLAASASPSTTTVTTSVPIARLSSLGVPSATIRPR